MDRVARILVVEDDPVLRQLMVLTMAEEGYEVEEACDGGEALEQAARMEFDVILLDIMMPKMDGWAFIERYTESEGQHARVIICSALIEADPRVADLPAVGFLQKPFSLHDLCACVERSVQQRR